MKTSENGVEFSLGKFLAYVLGQLVAFGTIQTERNLMIVRVIVYMLPDNTSRVFVRVNTKKTDIKFVTHRCRRHLIYIFIFRVFVYFVNPSCYVSLPRFGDFSIDSMRHSSAFRNTTKVTF